MTVSTGAASHSAIDWNAINWQEAQNTVNRLQARIVKAVQSGKWNKVKALQYLLTNSFSGKAIAVKRVTENQGKKTPGVDGDIWPQATMKVRAIQNLKRRGYKPQPLRRIYIPKSNGGKRPLGIPTMYDRAMQALYLLALDPVVETTSDPGSYGFRKRRSTADALRHCHQVLGRRVDARFVLEADIKACFDRIDHEWLVKHAPMDKVILKKWLKAGYMEQGILHDTQSGTPQGGIISPTLANVALNGLERHMRERFPKGSSGLKVNVIRYADDFVITGSSRELLENEVKPAVTEFLRERGLELSIEKTLVTSIHDGFNFLGQHVRRYNDNVTLVTPSKKNVKTFLSEIQETIMKNLNTRQEDLIRILNAKVRGWANYHKHACSKKIFNKVDHMIFWMLWRWAQRRHPNKLQKWIKGKYFGSLDGRSWVFHTTTKKDGRSEMAKLYKAADMRIVRHTKIRGYANPYDQEWIPYFEKRQRENKGVQSKKSGTTASSNGR